MPSLRASSWFVMEQDRGASPAWLQLWTVLRAATVLPVPARPFRLKREPALLTPLSCYSLPPLSHFAFVAEHLERNLFSSPQSGSSGKGAKDLRRATARQSATWSAPAPVLIFPL